MEAWLHGGDSRCAAAGPMRNSPPTPSTTPASGWPPSSPATTSNSASSAISILETILPDLLATFGALPARADKPAISPRARKVVFPESAGRHHLHLRIEDPTGLAIVVWQTDGIRGNTKTFRRLNILAEILSDRLREEIREKLGASYSPNAGAGGSDGLEELRLPPHRVQRQTRGPPAAADTCAANSPPLAAQGATDGRTRTRPQAHRSACSKRPSATTATGSTPCSAIPRTIRTASTLRARAMRLQVDQPQGTQRPRQEVPIRRERVVGDHQAKVVPDFDAMSSGPKASGHSSAQPSGLGADCAEALRPNGERYLGSPLLPVASLQAANSISSFPSPLGWAQESPAVGGPKQCGC